MFPKMRIVKASLRVWLPGMGADVFVMAGQGRVLVNCNHGDEYNAAEGENLLSEEPSISWDSELLCYIN